MKWDVRTIDRLGLAAVASTLLVGALTVLDAAAGGPAEPPSAQDDRTVAAPLDPAAFGPARSVEPPQEIDRRVRLEAVTPSVLVGPAAPSTGTEPLPMEPRVTLEPVAPPDSATSGPPAAPGLPEPTPQPTVHEVAVEFVVSSFNVLGSSHTRKGGNKKGFAPGGARAVLAAELLKRHDVSVVGFQELEIGQLHTIQRATGGRYAMYPGVGKHPRTGVNSVAWRRDEWTPVVQRTVAIPYFYGRDVQMPVVLLRHNASGEEVWFANFHNPASTKRRGNQQRWRDVATDRQIRLANELLEEGDGTPVIFTGDFNERAEYFCRLLGSTPMTASIGGSHDGVCRPPKGMGIDWIFGSPGISWATHLTDRSPLVRRASDHPMIVATARMTTVVEVPPTAEERALDEARRALARSGN